jgi:hypothetical protein
MKKYIYYVLCGMFGINLQSSLFPVQVIDQASPNEARDYENNFYLDEKDPIENVTFSELLNNSEFCDNRNFLIVLRVENSSTLTSPLACASNCTYYITAKSFLKNKLQLDNTAVQPLLEKLASLNNQLQSRYTRAPVDRRFEANSLSLLNAYESNKENWQAVTDFFQQYDTSALTFQAFKITNKQQVALPFYAFHTNQCLLCKITHVPKDKWGCESFTDNYGCWIAMICCFLGNGAFFALCSPC